MNLKVGAIFRPANWLRLGIALHSASFLAINEEYDTKMVSSVHYVDYDGVELESGYTESSVLPAGILISDYYIKTPGKAIFSLAFLINKMALINIDYERVNYSKISMDSYDFNLDAANDVIKSAFRASNNIRLGMEVKLGAISIRSGAAYYDSPYQSEKFSILNELDKLSYSAGLGVNKGNFFVDLAYVLTNYKKTEYFYSVPENYSLVGAEVSTQKSKVLATLGFRF